jgi:hypothetical protein
MKEFVFCKQTVKRDGTVKPGRNYTIKADDDGTVTLRTVNMVRRMLDRIPLDDNEGQDGYDVSGAGANSPSQIIWQNGRFIAVPYNEGYVRARGSGSKSGKNKSIEYPIPIYVLADIHEVSPEIAIKVCHDCGFGKNLTEYDSLTKEQADRAAEKIEEYKNARVTGIKAIQVDDVPGVGISMSGDRRLQ